MTAWLSFLVLIKFEASVNINILTSYCDIIVLVLDHHTIITKSNLCCTQM